MPTKSPCPQSLSRTVYAAILCAGLGLGTMAFAPAAAAHGGEVDRAEAGLFAENAGFIPHLLGQVMLARRSGETPSELASNQINPAATFIERLLTHLESAEEREFVGVTLYDENARSYEFFVLPLDGEVTETQAKALAAFFHCRRTGKQRKLHQGVIAMLADVARNYPGQIIEVISAYRGMRSESRTSPHRAGRAIDIRVRGTKATALRDYLWTHHSHVGIGYYAHSGYVHMDTRPKENDISWTQRRRGEAYRYNPGWAARARAKVEEAQPQAQAGRRS